MGWGSLLGSIAGNFIAPGVGGSIGGMLGGALDGSNGTKTTNATSTQQNQIDPRMASILYGGDGKGGLLNQIGGLANKPQNDGMQRFGNFADQFVGNAGGQNASKINQLGNSLIDNQPGAFGIQAFGPGEMMWNQAAQISAPSQNNVDLKPAYQDMIYGQAGANPYLTGAIQKGINQSNNAFTNMQQGATDNLMKNIMPGIRSNSVLSGQYGGSRQGIAEGNAIGDFAKAQQQAISQFGQNNTDAAVSAQAGAYDSDRNRALSAMQGLGAQQYGVASQNAQLQQQANMQNQIQGNAAGQFMGAQAQDAAKFNANLGVQQRQQNINNSIAGAGLLSGQLGNMYGYGQNQDQYGINNALKAASGIAPFTQANSTNSQTNPYFSNGTAQNAGMGGLLGGLFGGGGSAGSNPGGLLDLFGKSSNSLVF